MSLNRRQLVVRGVGTEDAQKIQIQRIDCNVYFRNK